MTMLQKDTHQNRSHMFLVLTSPIIVVLIGHIAARLFLRLWGNWAWLGSSIIYWGSMILIIWLIGDKQSWSRWFNKSQGSKWWIALALGLALIPFPLLFFPNMGVMKPFGLVIAWFLFAAVNSTCEEVYWRGFCWMKPAICHVPSA
jgi:hypothetical protein